MGGIVYRIRSSCLVFLDKDTQFAVRVESQIIGVE